MTNSIVLLTLTGPALLAVVAMLSRFEIGPRPRYLLGAMRLATMMTCLLAMGSALHVVVNGAQSSELLGVDPIGFSIRLDALSVILFGLVAFVGAVVVQFSRNYLDGNERQGVFLGRLCLTLCAVCILVLSGSLFQLVVAWVATSVALHRLLLFYADRPRAVVAAKKKFLCARIGDAFLLLAAVLLCRGFGTGDIAQILGLAREMLGSGETPLSVQGAALSIVLAAVFKSAQFPLHGWLTEVMETPTPVSALLHAGIVNAGGFLAIRFSDVLMLAAGSMYLLIFVGGMTALVGTVVMLTQTNVKSALAWSTISQMGFMLLQCGFGAFAAATLHIVAHSLYKAHAFLASGSAVDIAQNSPGPERQPQPQRVNILAAVLGSALIFIAAGALWGVSPAEKPAIVALGAILIMGLAQLVLRGLSGKNGTSNGGRVLLVVAGLSFTYFGLQRGASWIMGDSVAPPVALDAAGISIMLIIVALFGAISTVQYFGLNLVARWPGAYVHLANGLYANAIFDRAIGSLIDSAPNKH